jgi:hypothetical protein
MNNYSTRENQRNAFVMWYYIHVTSCEKENLRYSLYLFAELIKQ